MERSKIPGLRPGQRHPDWSQLYTVAKEETLPWHFPHVDPDIQRELRSMRGPRKTILDVGCGLGNQVHLLSEQGHQVSGTDVSEPAVRRATVLYPGINFFVDDITRTALTDVYDIVIDRGCFHVLDHKARAGYLSSVNRLLAANGMLLLKVMSTENLFQDFGPLCFSKRDLHQLFADAFQILKIQHTIYHGSTAHSPRAWFAVMRKKESHV